jgi:hypothetical protein
MVAHGCGMRDDIAAAHSEPRNDRIKTGFPIKVLGNDKKI